MGDIRFDGRVVIVTGAGGGLGKAYALLFAQRGAKVVVNDLGTSHKGEGKGTNAADLVVDEIKKAGGQAVANYDSVEDGDKIVKTAIDAFGRVDILINNAGILRDVSFVKMKDQDWDLIYRVHLKGSYSVSKAAWPYMRDQGYGKIIMTASAAGIYGNFGQANYSAMKLALVGLANTLALEGAGKNIHVNTIAPVAGTRMTATVMPPDLVEALKPEYVAPLVAYLCHEKSTVTGSLFEVGAGWISKLRWERTQGVFFDISRGLTPEQIQANWNSITDFTDATHPATTQESLSTIIAGLAKAKEQGKIVPSHTNGKKGNEHIPHPDKLVGYSFPASKYQITPHAVALYNLAIGAARNEPTDPTQLSFVYENSEGFQPLPTMGVIFAFSAMMSITGVPDLNFNPMMLLHGEQILEIKKPIPTEGVLTNHARIKALYDKGKGAVLVVEADSKDEKNETVVHNEYSVFIRGIGGFGGDRGPSGEVNVPPNRQPDAVHKETTARNEALLYRLASGDMNPLHADPAMAAIGGMDKPILHGLCSFGYACRAVLQHYCGNNPARFKAVQVRFAKHVFPGETLTTEMWQVAPNKVVFRTKVEERGEYCITNAAVEIVPSQPSGGSATTAQSEGEFKAAPVFANLEKLLHAGGPALVKKVNGVFHFHLTGGPGGQSRSWGIDLKTGPEGKLVQGKPEGSGVTLTLSDEDFALLFTGKLDSQTAFMQGRLKISGDMGLAMKLGELTKNQAKL